MRSNQIQEGNVIVHVHFVLPLAAADASSLNVRAGFPATTAYAGTFLVTTLPAPTIACSPTTTLQRIVAPDPMDAPFWITVASTFQSFSVCSDPSSVVARG